MNADSRTACFGWIRVARWVCWQLRLQVETGECGESGSSDQRRGTNQLAAMMLGCACLRAPSAATVVVQPVVACGLRWSALVDDMLCSPARRVVHQTTRLKFHAKYHHEALISHTRYHTVDTHVFTNDSKDVCDVQTFFLPMPDFLVFMPLFSPLLHASSSLARWRSVPPCGTAMMLCASLMPETDAFDFGSCRIMHENNAMVPV
ncbi:hypothetical protein BKA63DRAFT_274655 [Paraphoma chrysanthemicola]|nr:hypothetical protein BKA63DRAFT_274655 [Paraphoma chrysanthemicola]